MAKISCIAFKPNASHTSQKASTKVTWLKQSKKGQLSPIGTVSPPTQKLDGSMEDRCTMQPYPKSRETEQWTKPVCHKQAAASLHKVSTFNGASLNIWIYKELIYQRTERKTNKQKKTQMNNIGVLGTLTLTISFQHYNWVKFMWVPQFWE